MELRDWLGDNAAFFEELPTGRIRCRLNGSEFVPRLEILCAFAKYGAVNRRGRGRRCSGRKFQRLVEMENAMQELRHFEPFFTRSRNFADKVYCTLTGQLIGFGKGEIRLHMSGRKFQSAREAFLQGNSDLKLEPELSELMEGPDAAAPAHETDGNASGEAPENGRRKRQKLKRRQS